MSIFAVKLMWPARLSGPLACLARSLVNYVTSKVITATEKARTDLIELRNHEWVTIIESI